jgi:hypothetical protein
VYKINALWCLICPSACTMCITPSRNFVEARWRSLFRSTSLGKRCASYNAPPTSRKRAAGRWSLRNFLPRTSRFMVGRGRDLDCMANVIIWFYQPLFPSRTQNSIQISPHEISGLFQPRKGRSEANVEVINGLQHVFEKLVECCKKCIAWQGRYLENETITAPLRSSDSE